MPRRMSKGTCNLCGGTFAKNAITRHLKSCPKVTDVNRTAPTQIHHLNWRGGCAGVRFG